MRAFWTLWITQATSLLGSQAVQFALIWWLTTETGSATVLATAGLVGLAPQILIGPLLGAVVDRHDRKRVMLAADTAIAAASLLLAALFAAGAATPFHVYGLLFVRSIGGGLHGPAMQAATSLMVPAEHLARIQGLNQAIQGGMLIVAAPAGALLAAALPMSAVMMVDVGTALIAILALLATAVPEPARADGTLAGRASIFGDMAAGLGYLRARRGHVVLVGIASSINFWLVPAFSLLPLLVLEELAGDATQFGWMYSAFGIGSLAGGIALGIWGGFESRLRTSLVALALLGLAVFAVGAAPAGAAWMSIAAMLTVGLLVPTVNGPILAIFQSTIAPEYQGRVFTLLGSLSSIAIPLGLVLAALLVEGLGVRVWFFGGGASCVLAAIALALVPAVRRIEESASPSTVRRESAVST